MSSGESAADKVRGLFKGGENASEGVRQNINSFADELVNPAQNTGASGPESSKPYTTGTTSMSGTHSTNTDHGSRTLMGSSERDMGSSGFNKDAEKLGEGLRNAMKK